MTIPTRDTKSLPRARSGFLSRLGVVVWACRFALVSVACLVGWAGTSLITSRSQRHVSSGIWLRRSLIWLGPLYIKIGQILATNSGVLPEGVLSQLKSLHDDVSGCEPSWVSSELHRAYGVPIEEVFQSFDSTPIASASIAQVHRGVLPDGRVVAIKIVKKGVRTELFRSLRAISAFLRVAERLIPAARRLNACNHFEELVPIVADQVDLHKEVEHQIKIRRNFEGHPHVLVPEPITELCTSTVLVMEFMEGTKGNRASDVPIPRSQLASRMQDAFFTMVYLHDCFHADPHPGNLLFTSDGKIILLDFGLVGALSEEERWGLSSFYYAATRKEWALASDRFYRYFVTTSPKLEANIPTYREAMDRVLRKHYEVSARRWSTVSFVDDANQVLLGFDARLTTSFTKVALSFLTGEGFVSQVDPEIDIWMNARKFTERVSPYVDSSVKQTFDRYFLENNPQNDRLRNRAASSLISSTHLDRFLAPSLYPIFVRRAQGARLEDADGLEYIDLSGGFGPHFLGYGHPDIQKAIHEAVDQGSINAVGHLGEIELAEELLGAFPAADRVVLSNSGTEAVLHALRMCRAYRRRDRVAKFEGQYHGFSDQGLVSSWVRFSGDALSPNPIAPTPGVHQKIVDDTLVLQYGEPTSLSRLREQADQLACVLCEPMPATLGSYDAEFLAELSDLCREFDLPLVFDEVVTGFRVAYGGAQNLARVTPDLTCLGKIIGGGTPCGAVVGREALLSLAKSSSDPFIDVEEKVFVGGTLAGNSITCAAGLAAVRFLKRHPHVYEESRNQTRWLCATLRQIAERKAVPVQIAGEHSILTVTFSYRRPRWVREQQLGSNFRANLALAFYMRTHGVYLPELHTAFLSIAHTQDDLQQVADAFESSLASMVSDGIFSTRDR
jgi:glutamate-1-semialdehyde 2,1-aminomutase